MVLLPQLRESSARDPNPPFRHCLAVPQRFVRLDRYNYACTSAREPHLNSLAPKRSLSVFPSSMAPKGKSSATSGTRKKHARKAAVANGPVDEPPVPKEKKPKGKDKKSKKEPRKKVYIPPVKPAPAQPDPLDTLGLAQKLPPELLVVLRLLSKKDTTTKRRALEDLQTAWIGRAKRDDEGEYLLYTLQEIIPVWVRLE